MKRILSTQKFTRRQALTILVAGAASVATVSFAKSNYSNGTVNTALTNHGQLEDVEKSLTQPFILSF